jgi:polyisoprenoid-binding protein YceI
MIDRKVMKRTMFQMMKRSAAMALLTGTTATSDDRYQVTGELSLHGTTRSITVPVMLEKGRYIGSTRLKQTDFGITPVRIAGGTVKVKDEVEMSFEVVPTPPPSGPAPGR